jgi:hypothetical protein
MRRVRGSGRVLRLAGVLAVACLSLFMFAASHGRAAEGATASDSSTGCAPETSTCAQAAIPCPAANCTATAGPVTNIGSSEAVYVQVTNVPIGDELEVAYCSLAAGTQVVAEPECASQEPPNDQDDNTAIPQPQQYEYYAVSSDVTVVSIQTQYDPDIQGSSSIIAQTGDQVINQDNAFSTFFCDNGNNPCGVEVMDVPKADLSYVNQAGVPPLPGYSAVGHTVIFPVTFSQGGNGCGSAPIMQVDASYSAAQFIPSAAAATCTDSTGVAALPTELNSVDDPGCSTGAGTSCPIEDVIDGNTPVTFTDDPEDPATLAELKAAGGKFALIPIAVSATELAFAGEAGATGAAGSVVFGLSSYKLTPAQAAGIMTQTWGSATAGGGKPTDDICAELTGKGQCTEMAQADATTLKVETAGGNTDNLAIASATQTKPMNESFDFYQYSGNYFNFASGEVVGVNKKDYIGDTGYALLNPWPFTIGSAATGEQTLGAMWPSTASGATFESTGWMCNAPDQSYPVNFPFGGEATVSDILSGQQILADAEYGPVPVGNILQTAGQPSGVVEDQVRVPASKCKTLSTLPIDFGSQGDKNSFLYQPSSSPITASAAIEKAMKFYGGSGGFAFSAMDSSEADFFGLLPASLQNAAGAFVAPTAQSVNDALNDATQNPDGTLSPSFDDTSDASAYPLPMVTYALVSTSPQPSQDQATQLKDLLTNLVDYDHSDGTSAFPLPAGYYPMSDNLYSEALTDISNDVVGPSGSGSGGSSGSSANASPGSGGGAAASAAARPGGSAVGVVGAGSSAGSSAAGASATPSSPSAGGSSGNVVGHFITVTVGDSRFFVPSLLILALLCLLAGPLLYMSPRLRTATQASGDEGAASDGGEGPGEPPTPETG